MKKLLTITLIAVMLMACEKESCEVKRAEIFDHYEPLIRHAGQNGNQRKVQLLKEEQQNALDNAC